MKVHMRKTDTSGQPTLCGRKYLDDDKIDTNIGKVDCETCRAIFDNIAQEAKDRR